MQSDRFGTITTRRLLLRRATWHDLEDIHSVMSDPDAMRFWSRLPHATLEETRTWFPGALLQFDNPNMDERVIVLSGRVVGYMGIWNMPEFGFILHHDFWGSGYATEAAEAIIPKLFSDHPIEHLTADVDPRNSASLRLLHKLGFVITGRAEGTFLVGDEWCDSVYLELSRAACLNSIGKLRDT
jgi:Acetyltransferases, including N-acetylases of ribosomal proteins